MPDDNVIVDNAAADAAGTQTAPTQEEVETLKKQIEEKDLELQKLKEKDLNFKKLRSKTAGKEEKLDKYEEIISQKAKELEDKHDKFIRAQFQSAVDRELAHLCGEDKDLKEKVMFNYEHRLMDEVITPEQAIKKLRDAHFLETGQRAEPNPIAAIGAFSSGGYQRQKTKSFADTDAGKDFLRQIPGMDQLLDK